MRESELVLVAAGFCVIATSKDMELLKSEAPAETPTKVSHVRKDASSIMNSFKLLLLTMMVLQNSSTVLVSQ